MNAVGKTLSIWNTINLKTHLCSFDMDGRLFYFPTQFDDFFVCLFFEIIAGNSH